MMATARTWLTSPAEPAKVQATSHSAHATMARPTRCRIANTTAAPKCSPVKLAPNSASTPWAVTRRWLGHAAAGARLNGTWWR